MRKLYVYDLSGGITMYEEGVIIEDGMVVENFYENSSNGVTKVNIMFNKNGELKYMNLVGLPFVITDI